MDSAEDRLIARFFRPLASAPGALALSDDAAFFTVPEGHDTILTTDAIIEGIHVIDGEAPDAIARKALRVNLSDLAAKGAKPAAFLLSLALPENKGEDWLAAFCAGLKDDSEHYQCPLFGGDTDRTKGPLTVTIFALGLLPRGSMVKRSGARPGERIAATGEIGDAALGLMLRRDPALAARWGLDEQEREHLLARYRLPQPRVALAGALRDHVSAAIDVSDGFAGDVSKLLRVSGVSGEVMLADVPLSAAARKALCADPALCDRIYAGGDDYEIVCTIADDKWPEFQAAAQATGIPIHAVGRVAAGTAPPRFLDSEACAVAFRRPAFSHF